MKTAVAVVLLIVAMLAGAWGVNNIWNWLSLVSEGKAGEASLQTFLMSLLLVVIVLAAAAKIVDWLGDAEPNIEP